MSLAAQALAMPAIPAALATTLEGLQWAFLLYFVSINAVYLG